jgi:hypothetical protein
VIVPKLETNTIEVQVPWITKNSSVAKVRLPVLRKEIIHVHVPFVNGTTGDVDYSPEEWQQQTLSFVDGYVRGTVKFYRPENWQETRVIYVSDQVYKQTAIPRLSLPVPRLRVNPLERISMAVLGGSYEDVQEIYTSEFTLRSGIKVEHKGIAGVLSPVLSIFSINKL